MEALNSLASSQCVAVRRPPPAAGTAGNCAETMSTQVLPEPLQAFAQILMVGETMV